MSVTQVTQQLTDIQKAFEAFKTGYDEHFKKVYDLENHFMNAFEDFSAFVSAETVSLFTMLSKHTDMVNSVKTEHDKNKFEEGNFNRVSIIKKQDDTIKMLEIKVAELEMRLSNAEKQKSDPVVTPQPEVTTVEHQCYARVGKAKYNISKQAPDFMDEFPEGTFVTKTGCVVGLPCGNMVTHANVLFCHEHNTGKFEDIRTEPGSTQATVVEIKPAVEQVQPIEKKKPTTRKKKDATQTVPVEPVVVPVEPVVVPTEPVVVPAEPVVVPAEPVVVPAEPVVVPAEPVVVPTEPVVVPTEPVVVPTEPVVVPTEPVVVPTEPVVVPTEPVVVQTEPVVVPTEPVVVPTEPVIMQPVPPLILKFENETTLDQPSPPMSPEVDINNISENITIVEPVKEEPMTVNHANIEPPSFDDIEFYDDPVTGKTYYLDSKTKRIFEIAPNDEIGVFVKQL